MLDIHKAEIADLLKDMCQDVINKQTIGRGLLTAEGKEYFYIYDLIDDMPTGKIIKHGNAKMKTFINSKFVTSRRVFYLKN